jgi:tetratricopeptide (TPR) repeat protein/predicted Ser/Thr protein kinase
MIGQSVSHYKILEKLGAGGMGVVYKAEDTKLRRTVALKFLPPELTRDQDAKKRFVREAQAASALDHPNICTVHEIGETADGQMFICMAYYDGETLGQRIERGFVAAGDAVRIVREAAQGLAKAHTEGIIHRDIKPANVILTRDGQIKIMDFGLAKLATQSRMTKTGSTVGTVAYMSPEQARGENVGAQSDLFSLGVVLYELLTGERPFVGDHDAAIMYGIMHNDPRPLADYERRIPDRLQGIVDGLLEKEVRDRYQSAEDLVSDLKALESELRPSAPVRSARQRKARVRRRGSATKKWAAAAVVVVALGIAVFAISRRDRHAPSPHDLALAVVDFRDLAQPEDATISAELTSLVHVGLVENSPIRVVSPTYLHDLQRRLFGSGRGLIEEDQALELARKSGASFLLTGQIAPMDDARYVTWHLVETASGESLGGSRVDGLNPADLADRIIGGVVPLIARETGNAPAASVRVGELTTESPEAYRHYVAGILASEKGHRGDSIRELERSVELDSTFALAYFELARAHYSSAGFLDRAGAIPYADKAWSLRTRLSVKDRMRLEAYRAVLDSRVQDAKATYYEMLDRWPDDSEVLKDSASLLYFSWYTGEAERVLERAMELYPDDTRLLDLQRSVLRARGRPQEYLRFCLADVERQPQNPDAWDDIGQGYLHLGLPDSAEAAFRRALEIDPKFFSSRAGISFCSAARGNVGEAIRTAEEILETDDLLPAERREMLIQFAWQPCLSLYYFERGQYEKALGLFDRSGQSGSEWYYRGWLLLRMGKAGEVLREARSRQSRSLGPMNLEARALVALDSLETARRVVDKLYDAEKMWGGASVFIARKVDVEIALADGSPDSALAILEKIERNGLGPGGLYYIEYLEARARAYWMAGRMSDARREFESLFRVYGYHAIAYYEVGQLYQEMGRTGDAIGAYKRFLEMWSEADEGLPQIETAKDRLHALEFGP